MSIAVEQKDIERVSLVTIVRGLRGEQNDWMCFIFIWINLHGFYLVLDRLFRLRVCI